MRTRKNFLPLNKNLIFDFSSLLTHVLKGPTFVKDKNGCIVFNRNRFQTTILIHFGNNKVMIKNKVYQSMKRENAYR